MPSLTEVVRISPTAAARGQRHRPGDERPGEEEQGAAQQTGAPHADLGTAWCRRLPIAAAELSKRRHISSNSPPHSL